MKKIILGFLVLTMMIPSFRCVEAVKENEELDYTVTLEYTDLETFEEEYEISEENELYSTSGISETGLFYDTLSETGKELYNIIDNNTPAADANTIVLSTSDGYTNEILEEMGNLYFRVMQAYLRDHPENLLWATGACGMRCSYSGDTTTYYFTYNVLANWNVNYEAEVNQVIQSIIENMPENGTYNKVKYFHDYLIDHNDYSYSIDGLDDRYVHTALASFLWGGGVCESYAKAFKILCNEADIYCTMITSENHAWNYVKMPDGQWYMIDCTWDDPISSTPILRYDYFLISNYPCIDSTHYEDADFLYPRTADHAYDGSKTADLYMSGLPFVDVSSDRWYYSSIVKTYSLGLMTGIDTIHFNPEGTMNRAMIATVLYRMSGSQVSYQQYFTDVPDSKYYSEAVTWCAMQGIITGDKESRTFRPADAITRQDFVLMLYRYAGSAEVDSLSNLDSFPDGSLVSGYAKAAMSWAISTGIISGKTMDGMKYLCPKQTASRAECAKMLSVAYSILSSLDFS